MLGKKIIGATLPLLFLLVASSSGQATTRSPKLASLRQSVLALDSAWSMALKDLQQKKLDNVLQESERKDYAKFIIFLSTRIDEYCKLLRENGGPSATVDLPCSDSSSMGSGLDNKKEPAQSTSEQIAALDQSLSETLGDFDELLLKEEERIAQRTPRQRESGQEYSGSQGRATGGQSGSGGRTGKAQGSTGSGGQDRSGNRNESQDSGQNPAGQGHGSQASGGAGAGARSGQTTDNGQQGGITEIASGYDDIVARQLREAAQKETDPELKEKLWEEYRKYKEGIH